MQKLLKYVVAFTIITTVGIFYDKYKSKYLPDEELAQIDMVNRHLLGDNGYNTRRPILWIHTDNEMNARNWVTFGSRNTTKNDMPFLELCLKSIIKHCGESFNICLIDDTSYEKLIPDWKIKVNNLASPLKENIRLLSNAKLLYNYGGMILPDSTAVLEDLLSIYNKGVKENGFFVGNTKIDNTILESNTCYPNKYVLGCIKNNGEIKKYINYLEEMISKDYTSENEFNMDIEKYLSEEIKFRRTKSLCCEIFGSSDANGNIITIDKLMSDKAIEYTEKTKCIVIPKKDLIKRTQYGWFLKLSQKEIINSNFTLARLMSASQN